MKGFSQQKKCTVVALEALYGWLIIAVHEFTSTSQRGADDRKWCNHSGRGICLKMIRSAQSIECKLKIRSIPIIHVSISSEMEQQEDQESGVQQFHC